MRCPTLADLPEPPPGRLGWPWTEETPHLHWQAPADGHWPRVSIVTPSFNQVEFLEETIRSVLLQGYPDLEYVIIDGGSTDASVEIIRKYEPWLAHWVSEPDRGQSDAINKGFAQSSGEIFGWLNSDDVYEPGTLHLIARQFSADATCMLVYGNGWYIDDYGTRLQPCDWIRPFDRKLLLSVNYILQPTAFWRKSLWSHVRGLNTDYHYAMDWDLWIRASAATTPVYLAADLARWRIRQDIKTRSGGHRRRAEIAEICRRYGGIWQPTYLIYQLDRVYWSLDARLRGTPLERGMTFLSTPARWAFKEKLWRGRYLS